MNPLKQKKKRPGEVLIRPGRGNTPSGEEVFFSLYLFFFRI